MDFIRHNGKYFILFFLFLFFYIVFFHQNCSYDVLWNYGFSHAIRMGEIPYVDFNTVSTPFYSYLMSIGLFLYDDISMFFLEQTILVVLMFYFIFQLHGEKGWLLLPVLVLPFFLPFNPTYNFFAFFLLVVLYWMEKKEKEDYWIGFVLGILILTKHTIGLPVLFLSLLSTFQWKKIWKRFLGAALPCLVFLLILVLENSFSSFWDLCIMGLLDFGEKNHSSLNGFMFLTAFFFLLVLISFIRNIRRKESYYAFAAFSFCIPIFDYYHVGLLAALLLVFYLDHLFLPELYVRRMSFVFLSIFLIVYYLLMPMSFQNLTFLKKPHFRYMVVEEKRQQEIQSLYQAYSSYDSVYMIDSDAIMFDLMSNRPITYFDVLLKGNYGYHGTEKMINRVDMLHDTTFFIRSGLYENGIDEGQFDLDVLRYIVEHSKKIDSILNYDVYYKE